MRDMPITTDIEVGRGPSLSPQQMEQFADLSAEVIEQIRQMNLSTVLAGMGSIIKDAKNRAAEHAADAGKDLPRDPTQAQNGKNPNTPDSPDASEALQAQAIAYRDHQAYVLGEKTGMDTSGMNINQINKAMESADKNSILGGQTVALVELGDLKSAAADMGLANKFRQQEQDQGAALV